MMHPSAPTAPRWRQGSSTGVSQSWTAADDPRFIWTSGGSDAAAAGCMGLGVAVRDGGGRREGVARGLYLSSCI